MIKLNKKFIVNQSWVKRINIFLDVKNEFHRDIVDEDR